MMFSRRSFLKTGAAAIAGFTIAPNTILGKANGHTPPSDLPNIAAIGVGSQGGADIQNIATPDVPINRQRKSTRQFGGWTFPSYGGLAPKREVGNQAVQMGDAGRQEFHYANIYAICDVDTDYAGYIMDGYPKAKRYTDFRELIDKEKEIDGVLIGTPDHLHAIIAAYAMHAGKHVFVEKPMAKTIEEVRYLKKISKENPKLQCQMGNQGHNIEGTYKTVEWIRSGAIGDVTEVHMWSDRPVWLQGNIERPAEPNIPANLDYDLWLGPAPWKAFSEKTTHFLWRGLWDYGTGAMGDMGAHTFDAPIWALGLGMPDTIQATTTQFNSEYLPMSEICQYHFPAREVPSLDGKKKIKMPEVNVYWTDGGIKLSRPKELEQDRQLRECLYIGTKGKMMHGTHGANPELIPANPDWKEPAPVLHRPNNIYRDWVEAIKGEHETANNFEIAGKLTEIMLLTNIAVLSQQRNVTLQYDADKMEITNLPEANQFFSREYRKGWELTKF